MAATVTVSSLAPQSSLDQLAAEIRHEHEECLLAAVSSLRHAIRAGDALLVARDQVPRGQWERWLDENVPDVRVMAKAYMRIATYRDAVPPEVTTAERALKALRGLPAFDGSGPARHPESVRDRAVELAGEGLPINRIAAHLGVDRKCVRRWVGKKNSASREGTYRRGRPTRAQQKKHDEIAARLMRIPAKRAIGPLALANAFRAVVNAKRGGTDSQLIAALDELCGSAADWADQLRRADSDRAA
jgi:hypothetical protein